MTSKTPELQPTAAKVTVATPSIMAEFAEPVLRNIGYPSVFQTLYQVVDKNILTKECAVMEVRGVGCIVRTFTRVGDQISEALTFVPGVRLVQDSAGFLKMYPET